jgi:hypothetical protein
LAASAIRLSAAVSTRKCCPRDFFALIIRQRKYSLICVIA